MKLGMDCAVRCLRTMVPSLVCKDKLLLIYEYICRYTPGLPPFFTITQYVAKEIKQFHITKTYFYFRTICFCTQVVSLNKLAHIRNELSWEFNVGIITPWELVYQMVFCLKFRFVSFLLNFSH